MMQNCFGGLSKKYSQWNFLNELETKTQSVILGLASKIPVKSDIVFFTSQYKIWVKPSGEQSFLYGNHILKSGLGRITENTPQYQGVIVYSMNDLPLVSELNSRISVSHSCFKMQLTLLFTNMQSLSHFSIYLFCTSRSKNLSGKNFVVIQKSLFEWDMPWTSK